MNKIQLRLYAIENKPEHHEALLSKIKSGEITTKEQIDSYNG